jgi:hypothetical protein
MVFNILEENEIIVDVIDPMEYKLIMVKSALEILTNLLSVISVVTLRALIPINILVRTKPN